MFQLVTTVKTKTSQNTLHPVAAMLSDLPFVPVDVGWSWCPSYSEWTCMIIEHYSKNISCRKELLNLGVTAKSVINSWHFQWIKITWLIFWRNLSAHHQEKDADWSSEKTRACITFCSQRICFLCTHWFLEQRRMKRFVVHCDIPADQASVWFSVRDELSFPVELQQSLAAEAEAKRQHQVRVSNCTSVSV